MTQLLKNKLSARNLEKAVNTYAVPAVSYSFGVINWTHLKDRNRITSKNFTNPKALHPHTSVERFHLPRSVGGRYKKNAFQASKRYEGIFLHQHGNAPSLKRNGPQR